MIISRTAFYNLYQRTVDHFSKVHRLSSGEEMNLSQMFQLKGYNPDQPTLQKDLNNIPEAADYLRDLKKYGSKGKVTPRYLYDKKLRVDRQPNNAEVKINAPFDKLLFWYLGYDDYSEFLKEIRHDITSYTGYYYSYIDHQVKSFILRINYLYKTPRPKLMLHDYDAEQTGFHDTLKDRIYQGYAYLLDGKLQIIMMITEQGDRLRIFLEAGDNPEKVKVMRGTVVAVSSYPGKPLTSTEIVITRDDSPTGEKDVLRIKRYLMLHRYNFRINPHPLDLKKLESKGVQVDLIRRFVGAWKVYRYSLETSSIVCSLLVVRKDYRMTCFTSQFELDNLNEQVCLPNITSDDELNTRTICLNCFPKEGAKIISSMMLDIPGKKSSKLFGVLIFVGQDNEPSKSRSAILIKDDELTKKLADASALNLTNADFMEMVNVADFSSVPEHIEEELATLERANSPVA